MIKNTNIFVIESLWLQFQFCSMWSSVCYCICLDLVQIIISSTYTNDDQDIASLGLSELSYCQIVSNAIHLYDIETYSITGHSDILDGVDSACLTCNQLGP